ncbi:tyrosine-protein kinase transmembrane receptor Ror-like isoform X2 [Aethina tumida]|uniref:tyrosine-protein kinase transmembrane receptor Ror-like isoform X2 n=1 Tax=Aethina tumida TaxID=116153 RepID=UPI00214891B5|nr:tyrosine-protein kinase transmembrane receptor Ror-like isoform X2 [Aethina tumida]
MSRTFCAFICAFMVSVALKHVTSTISDGYDDEFADEDYDEDFSNLTSTTPNGTLFFIQELHNTTKDSGIKNLKLTCEVRNNDINNTNKINFMWRKNEAQVETDYRTRVNTTRKDNTAKSVLRIKDPNTLDAGFYECIVSHGPHKIKSSSYITFTPDASFGVSDLGTFKLDHTIVNEGNNGDITTFVPNLPTKLEDVEHSTASKTNTFSPPIEFDVPNQRVTENKPIYNGSEPFCQQYRGRVCHDYLSNKYVYVEPPYTQDELEENIHKVFMVTRQSNDITSSCAKFVYSIMCFSAFPICENPREINQYQSKHMAELKAITEKQRTKFKTYRSKLNNHLRRICREDCVLLENDLCSKEYAIAKRHPILKIIMELEDCHELPVETDKSSIQCLSLGVGDLNINKEDKCFWDTGSTYRGTKDTSINNNKCLRWAHQFHIPTSKHPELTGHNYCRNPGEMEDEPFCYVEQDRREPCGINKCVYVFGVYMMFIILGIGLFIGAVVSYCYCRRKNRNTRNLQNVAKNIYGNPGPSSPIEMNTLLPQNMPPSRNHGSGKNGLQTVPQYTYKEVRFLEELGEGAFGKVYKGELKTKNSKTFVAVKSLKENASAKTQADFQREIELISELKHSNIICLLGVVMKQEPMCMLFEFMSEGDLHEYLIANSPPEGRSLTHDQFLHIAIQIAQGMEYLSENHYVHRDLAARNCLVSKDMIVKISDFGLSRDMYSCDYYRVQSKSLLPVRWMPPESILYGKFTTESDVWSYGVVLWEIYSYGVQPYYGYNNQEVINLIRSRKLLPCPDACPSYCYALMVECWAEQAIRRPNFSEIAHRLKIWKQSEVGNGAYFRTPSNNPTPAKHVHGSKSSHTSDSQTLCPMNENQMANFTLERERERNKPSSSKLHDSMNSLTSRSSSMGNTTQSTTVSLEHKRDKRPKRNVDSIERLNPKNTIVNSYGDNFETKITQ